MDILHCTVPEAHLQHYGNSDTVMDNPDNQLQWWGMSTTVYYSNQEWAVLRITVMGIALPVLLFSHYD